VAAHGCKVKSIVEKMINYVYFFAGVNKAQSSPFEKTHAMKDLDSLIIKSHPRRTQISGKISIFSDLPGKNDINSGLLLAKVKPNG
jgi:hypothetical protein